MKVERDCERVRPSLGSDPNQEKFFDEHPVLYPWPKILRRSGLRFTYKPREVWWKGWIKRLGLKKGERLLEVGCGRGELLDRLVSEFGVRASGVDIAEKAIAEAKGESIYQHDLRAADACDLPFSDGFFDVVLSFDTLEHIGDPASAAPSPKRLWRVGDEATDFDGELSRTAGRQEKAVSEMARVLKKGGRILIYTINFRQAFTWNRLLSRLGVDIYKNVDHDPKLFVDPAWLKEKLEAQGVKVLGLDYFNSFFTLAADEAIMVSLLAFSKPFDWERTERFGGIVLKILTAFSVAATPILRVLDLPWIIFGHANGFLVLGEKR